MDNKQNGRRDTEAHSDEDTWDGESEALGFTEFAADDTMFLPAVR